MQLPAILRQIDWKVGSATPGSLVVVGIGGHGASGKTTLARSIARSIAGTQVVSTDQFFNGTIFELDRLRTDVVDVLLAGKQASYREWDWATGAVGQHCTVVPHGVVILEGVCALHHMFRNDLPLRLWIETSADVRLARGVARDGEASRDRWVNVWMPNELAYVERDQPMKCAHMIIRGDQPY